MSMILQKQFNRLQVFHDTVMKCKKNGALFDHNYKEAEYYDIQRVDGLAKFHEIGESHADIRVSPDDSYTAALRMKKEKGLSDVLVLNLANSTSPGGGVRYGVKAQEEDLCRVSSLYFSLVSQEGLKFYDYNKYYHFNKQGSDTAIYSPNVYIIKDNHYQDIQPVEVSVLTMAAPMQRKGYDMRNIMHERIYKMLCIAEDTGHKNLVLGAWGCGIFGNKSEIVAASFRKNLDMFDSFENVEFAIIPSSSKKNASDNYSCFMDKIMLGYDMKISRFMRRHFYTYDEYRNYSEFEKLEELKFLKSDVEFGLKTVIKTIDKNTAANKIAQEFLQEIRKTPHDVIGIKRALNKWWNFAESDAYKTNFKIDIRQFTRGFTCECYTSFNYFINGEFDAKIKEIEATGVKLKDDALVGKPTISSQKQSCFTDEDLKIAVCRLRKNFCDERIEDVKNISKYLYHMRVEVFGLPSSQ